MYLDDAGQLVLSPSDLVGYLACEHLSELSNAVARHELGKPTGEDPEVTVVQRRGLMHEAAYLAELRAEGLNVGEIGQEPLEAAVAHTIELLRAGVDVVYQAAFLHAGEKGRPSWRGHADFCRRVEVESNLGAFSYEPEDTKLARHAKPSAVLQLCEYAEQLGRLQGSPPEHIHIVLGGRERVTLRLADFAAYFRATKRRFEDALAARIKAYPLPVEHCAVCAWRTDCDDRRLTDGHLTTVAGLGVEHAAKLEAQGIKTVRQLAHYKQRSISKMSAATLDKLRHQARLQIKAGAHPDDPPPYELLACPGPGMGLAGIPKPCTGDLFFDIESDPFAEEGALEYLFGVGWLNEDRSFEYKAFWAHTRAEEKAAFEALVDFIAERREAHPAMHVYHYASYEPSALGRLMGRHGTRETEIDDFLRGGVLVDLFRVIRQGVRVGTPSYSLKKLEALYMPPRTEAITDGGSSIVQYEEWIETKDPAILEQLATYNEVDCNSTRLLRNWLETRRPEYGRHFGEPAGRPGRPRSETPEGVAAEASENADLRAKLAERGAAPDAGDPPANAMWLLGELLEWHRREEKPEWWHYFDRVLRCDEEDLFNDSEAVAGLTYDGVVRPVKRSLIHRYRFDPAQEHKLTEGAWLDPASERGRILDGRQVPGPGSIELVDPVRGYLELKRSASSKAPHPQCLIPSKPIDNAGQREAIRKVARSVAERGIDGEGPFRAVRDLLQRRPPRLKAETAVIGSPLRADGENPADAAVRVASQLDGGCLAVQGPPGSGKTRMAARAVVSLISEGHKVGITANSHAVISNLLREIVECAEHEGVTIRASQKSGDGRQVKHRFVRQRDNAEMEADIETANVFAGTAWLFTRPAFEGRLDYLIVDEAGQFSLANVVAVGTAARNLVLVGDPMQLAQPSKGSHPPGAEASALDHLLGEFETMPDDLGIFLATTHRLHPLICDYVSEIFYEGRLRPEPGCEVQAVTGGGFLGGSGLRWLPVDHSGNRTSSQEEADAIRDCCRDLLGRTWIDKTGVTHQLEAADILVVTPYNAQVALLAKTLPGRIQVGTVDKFQGRQAPVVIVSMATSSADEAPRGMEFLYSRNRLNVAVSRAQALTVLVAAPSLLAARCRTVDQLRLANGFCRFVEMAVARPVQ